MKVACKRYVKMPIKDKPFAFLEKHYYVMETLGQGGFAKVKLAIHLATDEKVAIKILDKKKMGRDLPRAALELETLRALSHPNVCGLFESFETESHYFFVLEYCPGGELFDFIVERDCVMEKEAKVIFRQIVSAMAYVHEMGFAHRDLKPENLLLDEKHRIKVIDFGLCARPVGGMSSFIFTSCGSPAYAAPELISGNAYLGAKADIWSMGVLLYALLVGKLPFADSDLMKMYHNVENGIYTVPSHLSAESKSLIKSMLQVDPTLRISMAALCRHPWLTNKLGMPVSWKPLNVRSSLDEDCVTVMSRMQGVSASQLAQKLLEWKFDSDTATYLLLLQKKSRGKNILSLAPKHPADSSGMRASLEGGLDNKDLLALSLPSTSAVSGAASSVVSERSNQATAPPSPGRNVIAQGGSTLAETTGHEFRFPGMPTPRRNRLLLNPGRSWGADGLGDKIMDPKMSPSLSMGAGLDSHAPSTPSRFTRSGTSGPDTSGSGSSTPLKSKMLGSLERGMNRVRIMLTPRKRQQEPQHLSARNLCNLSTTNCSSPDLILEIILNVLRDNNILCLQKGYVIKGKRKDCSGKTILSFKLEVCVIGPTKIVAILRRRLRGDTWFYKFVCEEVLKLTSLVNVPDSTLDTVLKLDDTELPGESSNGTTQAEAEEAGKEELQELEEEELDEAKSLALPNNLKFVGRVINYGLTMSFSSLPSTNSSYRSALSKGSDDESLISEAVTCGSDMSVSSFTNGSAISDDAKEVTQLPSMSMNGCKNSHKDT